MTDSTFVTPEEAPGLTVDASPDVEAEATPEATPVDADLFAAAPEVDSPGEPGQTGEDEQDDAAEDDESDSDADESDADESDADEDEPRSADPVDGAGPVASSDEASDRSSTASRLEAEGDIAADYLEELLDIADLDGDIDTYVEGGRAHVSIVTEGDQLVGNNGEVLEALQELARLAVMTETDHRSRLMLDIAGHRDRRRAELTVLAKDAIADVKQTGEAARLAPMNPFERKIIHDIVAEAGLVSESEGVEPKRRVIILP